VQTIQCANLYDRQSKELFKWRQAIPPTLSKLIFAVYNDEPVTFPVDVDESWPATQPAARAQAV